MAIIQVRSDDIDGTTGEEVENVRFLAGGFTYEIDLKPENREELETAIQNLIDAGARRVAGNKGTATKSSSIDTQAVREWAKTAGLDVSERGRIASDVLEAYENRNK